MKNKYIVLVMAMVLVLSNILLAGCFGNKTKTYLCAFPESSYEAELTYRSGTGAISNWTVIHRRETINNEEYLIHYLQYGYQQGETERTYNYLGVWDETVEGSDKWVTYVLNNADEWVLGTEQKDIDNREVYGTDKYYFDYYGSDFNRHALEARGYPFRPDRLVEETEDYLEYNEDGDVYRLSNNIYHICLYRGGEQGGCNHEFTKFTFNESTMAIPHINTLVL